MQVCANSIASFQKHFLLWTGALLCHDLGCWRKQHSNLCTQFGFYEGHSRGAYSSAQNYCTLFNNPNSHQTVKDRQICCLKRVMKLISHMLFQNTVASLCLEMLCSVPEWQFSSTVVKRKQQRRRNIVQLNQTGNIWQIGQNKAPDIIPREIYC